MGFSLRQEIGPIESQISMAPIVRVSLYGNYLVVGDPDAKSNRNGAAYFYRINPSSGKFDLIQTIDSPSPETNDAFGVSVSLYGNYLVVGDYDATSDFKGAAYFYRINPSSGKFDLIQIIDSPSPQGNDSFGNSVSLYGNYLVIGDREAKTVPSGKGASYFYRINPSSGKFDLIQTIDSPSPGPTGGNDDFGVSVSLYGNYLVVGDRDAKGDPTEGKGAAYFYRINPSSGKFDLIQTIDSPSDEINDDFGVSVSLYGNYLVAGDSDADSDSNGKVYFYRINPSSGKFDLIQPIDSPSPQGNDAFGVSVSLYGNYLVVGDYDATSDFKGAAYFYRINPSSGKFDLIQTIHSPSDEINDDFGTSVSLYGNYLVVGDTDATPDDYIAAYFYKLDR